MEDRDLTGKVTLRIDVSPTGRVTGTTVASSKGATSALEACMMKVVASWTFPAPAGGVSGAFSYPFAF
jgi:TonB family protein